MIYTSTGLYHYRKKPSVWTLFREKQQPQQQHQQQPQQQQPPQPRAKTGANLRPNRANIGQQQQQ